MTWIAKLLNQTAVYWSSPVQDGFGGFSYADPVEITVRWQDSQDLFTNAEGEEKVAKSLVWSETQMAFNGMIYLGTIADLDSSESADPQTLTGASRIQKAMSSPSVDTNRNIYKAFL